MADDEVLVEENEDEPTEIEVLQEINDNIKYLIKCIVPNSVYVDFEFPTDDSEGV